jgi:hypothetical protein
LSQQRNYTFIGYVGGPPILNSLVCRASPIPNLNCILMRGKFKFRFDFGKVTYLAFGSFVHGVGMFAKYKERIDKKF